MVGNTPVDEPPPPIQLPKEIIATLVEVGKRFEAGMALPPEEFAQKLYEDAMIGENEKIIFETLTKVADFEDAMAKISMFRGVPEFQPFITKLGQNRQWATAVLARVRELEGENK